MKQVSSSIGCLVLNSILYPKKYLFILFVLLLTFSSQITFAQQKSTSIPYVGTWQLVSATYTTASGTTKNDSSTIAEYKVITPQFFMYSVFRKGPDTLLISTTGTVSFKDNQMTHTAQYSTSKARVGITATYSVEVRGNNLYQKGKLQDTELEEVWVRLH